MAFLNATSDLPVGVHHWYFLDSACRDENVPWRSLNLHTSVEQPGHFCCEDGNCIKSGYVCDNVKHCEDNSDETNCTMVIFPEFYDKLLPPTKLDDDIFKTSNSAKSIIQSLTMIDGNFTVLDVLDVDEIDSTFDIYFKLDMRWYDINLKYRFLNDLDDKNGFNQSELAKIWRPEIQFIHISNNDDVIRFGDTIFVKKENKPPHLSGGLDTLKVSEIYDGSEHSINILMKRKIKFTCPFEKIQDYPFGIQKCPLHFYISGVANGLTKFNCSIVHPEFKTVGQYNVEQWTLEQEMKDGENMITVTMTLSRSFSSIFMVTYLPTILMNIINQATNYLTVADRYDLIITVNITCMMVLASVYLSVSNSLPSTPVIKPIEVWLLYNLAYPFFVIIINVVLQARHIKLELF